MHVGDCRNLAVDEGRRLAEGFEARPFFAMPSGRCLIIRQIGKRPTHDVTKIGFKRGAPLAFWQPAAAIRELVPDGRRNRAFGAMLGQMLRR